MNIIDFLIKNQINQIYISKSLYNESANNNINSLYENTLFYGLYYKEDIDNCINHLGKVWIMWDLNDCNSNFSFRVKNVKKIKKLRNIQQHLCHKKETSEYLNILKIPYYKFNTNVYHSLINYLESNRLITNLNNNSQIIIGIISCKKYFDKQNKIRSTWINELKKNNISYYFIIGHNSQTIVKDDILYVNSGDYYEDLPNKVSAFIKYIYENTNYEHLFKIDDDCYVNINYLKKLKYNKYNYLGKKIGSNKNNFNNRWHFNKCNSNKLNNTVSSKGFRCDWCGGGYGYILSRKSMEIISKNIKYLDDEIYEDKGIGEILFNNNIKIDFDINYKVSNKVIKNCLIYFDLNLDSLQKVHKLLT